MNVDASARTDAAGVPPNEPPRPGAPGFPVVGVGASAGGLAALVALFGQLPDDSGIAFVVVVPSSAQQESSFDSVLAQATAMPVVPVLGKVALEPNRVFLVSPFLQPKMNGGHLIAAEFERPPGLATAIDGFFHTLAEVQRERSLCVVLSGTGADGSVGLRRVKECGGMTLVQAPGDAQFDGMPNHAIATGCVDLVLPAAEIGPKLIELCANMRSMPPADPASRSVTLVGGPSSGSLKDLLIGTTHFFRDPAAFDALDGLLTQTLQRRAASHGRFRAWVPGCATGEEAYSIAMLLTEKVATLGLDLDLQVFATDIDEKAVAFAREGLYPDSIVADVAPARLRRFFAREESQVRVRSELRDKVVFAHHDLLHDPPFSQLDLVSCRNLLTDFDREFQAQVLQTFQFALQPGGLLFLGDSEGTDSTREPFLPIDDEHRIYRVDAIPRTGHHRPPKLASADTRALVTRPGRPPTDQRDTAATLHAWALEAHAPASVLVAENGNILHSTLRAGDFLRFVPGAPSQNLLDAVRVELRLELRAALIQAWRDRKSVQARKVKVAAPGAAAARSKPFWVGMTVHPVEAQGAPLVLVLFHQVDATVGLDAVEGSPKGPLQLMLESELLRTRDKLHGSLGEAAASALSATSPTSVEELRASGQELQAINEELLSTTEELEISRDELQSVNEELLTVNQALGRKVAETSTVNDDLKDLIASSDIAAVFVDRAMRIRRYTPGASRLFHLIGSDVGRPLLDIAHRLDYERLEEDAMEAFRSLRVIEREVTGEGGSTYLVRVRPYRTHDDMIDGAAINFVDMTAIRQAEQRLQVGRENLRLIAESTRDYAIIVTDPAGVVSDWNQGAERIFGYRKDEIVGQAIDVVFTPEDRAAGAPEAERLLAREKGRAPDERWHVAKDGRSFYCSGIMTPMFERGRLVGYAKIAREQTEQKRAEKQLEALLIQEKETRAELQRAIALKDEFLAVMSHELKQPLNLIHINAELMARLPEVRTAPSVARSAEIIRRAVLSQSKIIDDLLDLSRLRTGKFGLTAAPMDWRVTVNKVLDAVALDADRQGLTVLRDADSAAVPVQADAVRVEQIVWNLVSNALKFTPAGGTVQVRLAVDASMARLDVIDSGQGIAPDFIDNVFDMFRQADRSTTRPQGGMGIGLALVRQLAEAQGGRVAASSGGKGRGAHFSVWLPLVDAGLGDAAGQTPLPALAGLRVLAVDDTDDALQSFAMLLRLEGADVTAVANGAAALEALDDRPFDLLLSDVAMPGMDGHELIATVRARPEWRDLPAVALTGFGRPQDEQKAIAAGFHAHLAKPVVIEELLQTVSRLLSGRRAGVV